MNILFITYLFNNEGTGPNHSVPIRIQAQSEYDNVFWYNINNLYRDSRYAGVKCNSLEDYPDLRISSLPEPFDYPDIVIFEGVYFFKYCKLGRECRKRGIPYVIVPRSSLTKSAQNSKIIKKKIGNLLFFNRLVNKATAVQYLTSNEYEQSGQKKWNKKNLIIPNGIDVKNKKKEFNFNKTGLNGVFIGRLDIYQKGIDILLESCFQIKDQLVNNECTIEIYGPDYEEGKVKIQTIINEKELEDVVILKNSVFGSQKEKVLLNSDFFILTSRFEGHPMGLLEALSYGLPCLVTNGTNMAKEINMVDAGWTTENNAEGIAKALKSLLFEKKKRFRKKSDNALDLSKQYSWDTIARISNDKFKEVIK